MNVFNTVFFFAFLLSAAVQYNDPDAAAWIAIYLCAAFMCLAQLRGKLPRWLPLLLLIVSAGWIIITLPAIVGQVSWHEIIESVTMKIRAVEEAREIGGLALVAGWAAILLHQTRARNAAPHA